MVPILYALLVDLSSDSSRLRYLRLLQDLTLIDPDLDTDLAHGGLCFGEPVLDVRTQEEYVGDPRQPRSGHIPGARWWPWDNTVAFTDDFRLKPTEDLKRQLQALGVSATDSPVYLYCHTGHRASQTYYALRQLGFSKVKIYDGSMAEYSQHKELPLKTGVMP